MNDKMAAMELKKIAKFIKAGDLKRQPIGKGMNVIKYPDGMIGIFKGTTAVVMLEKEQAEMLVGLLNS